jgi:hypothetical protein
LKHNKEPEVSISEIEKAITKLSQEDPGRFRQWLDEYCDQAWERQIDEDAKSGRLTI